MFTVMDSATLSEFYSLRNDLEEEISKTEKSLISMLDDLEGNDFDMLGLDEFKMLLGGK